MIAQPQYTTSYRVVDPRDPQLRYDIDVWATPDEIAALVRDGYMVGRGWFGDDQIQRFRTALDRIFREEPFESDARIDRYGGWRYFRYLLDKDPAFLDLLHVIPPMTIAQAVLGPQVRLDHVEGKYGQAGVAGHFVPWHIHHRVIPDPIPPFFSYPHAIHCLLYLDDLDESNGQLCVVPGSHTSPYDSYVQDDDEDRDDQVALAVHAGDCVLLHSNLLHRVRRSRDDGTTRRLIVFGYLPAWMQAGEQGVPPDVRPTDELRRHGDAITRQLLGEFFWG